MIITLTKNLPQILMKHSKEETQLVNLPQHVKKQWLLVNKMNPTKVQKSNLNRLKTKLKFKTIKVKNNTQVMRMKTTETNSKMINF